MNLSSNYLTGKIRQDIRKLNSLVILDIAYNWLSGPIPLENGNLKNLTERYFERNSFTGALPSTLANLSQLTILGVSLNRISGGIPWELSLIISLTHLFLGFNQFTDKLPCAIANLTHLVMLDVSFNSISGQIPEEIGNLKNLATLELGSNNFNGLILKEIGYLKNLLTPDMSSNNFSGSIPTSFGFLSSLINMQMSSNFLIGEIPREIGKLENLVLSPNQISGYIPLDITNLSNLENLDLSVNNVLGPIPLSLYELTHLVFLDLSSNQINDFLNAKIGNFKMLTYLNLPNNKLFGNIPPEIGHLTWSIRVDISHNLSGEFKSQLNKTITGDLYFRYKLPCHPNWGQAHFSEKVESEERQTKNGDLFSLWNYDGKIAYEDNIQATEDFNIRYCIGTGAYGSVYWAELPSGKIVALKKLHQLESQEPSFDRSFRNEFKMLTEICHKNIVKLYGFCLHNRHQSQTLGQLESLILIPQIKLYLLELLDMLHQSLHTQSVTEKCDVYSFGVVALETIMGKHPGDLISSLRNCGAPNMLLKDVLDSRLPLPFNGTDAKILVLVVTHAFSCLHTNPRSRPTMKDFVKEFPVSKPQLLLPFNDISIQQLLNQESIFQEWLMIMKLIV
ncbi:hypothetical protein L6164_002790 [Bauhinia variegata]|uniref:Uncharacterized protein n=1 Tax=Bauhinia variegata TaxID=167791 RepID=A0ACB9Q1E2_BAUVA|nr:hypothetical protein L6164_002790 [Bauhinia variegata]